MPNWNIAAPQLAFPKLGISRATGISVAGMVGLPVVTLVALDKLNSVLHLTYSHATDARIYIPLALSLVVALVFFKTRYAEFSNLLKACMRASAAGLLAYLIIEPVDFSLGNAESVRALEYVQYGYPLGLVCAIVGLFRPSFIIPTAIYILSARHLSIAISSFQISFLDIRYMVDMAMYLAIFGLFVVKVAPRLPHIGQWLGDTDRQMEIVGVGFGLHLANYFWSGVAKVVIGPTPWYWAAENATQNQIPYTIEMGILPIGHIPWLAQFAHEAFAFVHVPLNAIIVLVQLFAIVCVLKVSWLKVTSILFDLLHIGIYVLAGLFFWPWIWNNLTIWWAARSSKQGLPLNTKVACIAAILLGFPALNINPAAWLAWFDYSNTRQIYFEAVTDDGRAVKVPSAFFLSHSYSVSHGYMGGHSLEGHYERTHPVAGGTTEYQQLSTGACLDPSIVDSQKYPETAEPRNERIKDVGQFLTFHHHKMEDREASLGRGTWYFRGHHHPSNPYLYEEFNKLSLKDVVGYNLVIKSVCVSMKSGKIEEKVLKQDTEFYDVR